MAELLEYSLTKIEYIGTTADLNPIKNNARGTITPQTVNNPRSGYWGFFECKSFGGRAQQIVIDWYDPSIVHIRILDENVWSDWAKL